MATVNLSSPEILKYGMIGLGVLFGALAFFLLSREQRREVRRKGMLRSMYLFATFPLILFLSGALISTQNAGQPLTDTSSPFLLTGNFQNDNLFLGTWKGGGLDFKNYGQKNPMTDGYHYENMTFEFTLDSSRNIILLNGDFSAAPKSTFTKKTLPRKIKGECKKDGEFLVINYEIPPLKNDQGPGMGVMMFDFTPSNGQATGFFISRSAITGGLVCGEINLKRVASK